MKARNASHDRYLRILWRYVLGESVDMNALAEAKAHLVSCPDCWRTWMASLAELAPSAWEQFLMESTTPFPQGPTFAQARQQARQASVQAGEGIWQQGRAYLARLSPEKRVRELLISLDVGLWPASPAMAHRSLGKGAPSGQALTIDHLPGLEATVHVTPAADDPQFATITVEVSMPQRFPDFSGTRIQLVLADRRVEKITGVSGAVTFARIPYAQLPDARVRVMPPDGELDQ